MVFYRQLPHSIIWDFNHSICFLESWFVTKSTFSMIYIRSPVYYIFINTKFYHLINQTQSRNLYLTILSSWKIIFWKYVFHKIRYRINKVFHKVKICLNRYHFFCRWQKRKTIIQPSYNIFLACISPIKKLCASKYGSSTYSIPIFNKYLHIFTECIIYHLNNTYLFIYTTLLFSYSIKLFCWLVISKFTIKTILPW